MLLFTDGFDAYGAAADLQKKWNINTNTALITWANTVGRFGGGGLQLLAGAATLSCPILTTNQVAGHVGFAFWAKFSAKPAGNVIFLYMMGAANTNYPCIGVNANGQMIYQTQSVTPGISASGNVCDGTWHWIEVMVNTSVINTNVTWNMWTDGTLVVNNAFIGNNQNAALGFQQFVLACVAGVNITIDDIIVIDDQAGLQVGEPIAVSVLPIGAKKIETYWPTGAGTNTNFTPLTGANYSQINETNPDGDTSYVSSAVSGIRDSYSFSSPVQGANIFAAIVNVFGKNADAGNINVQGLAYNGSSFGLGDSKPIAINYQTKQFPIFRDPNTSAAWTKAGINTSQFGVGVV
jgi:hypothetical protein